MLRLSPLRPSFAAARLLSFLAAELLAPAAAAGPPSTLRGLVRARDGAPIPGAEVRVQKGEEAPTSDAPDARAGEDGSFEVSVPSPGAYAVWASAPGYLDGRAGPVEVAEGARVEGLVVSLFFVGRASARFTFLDLEGKPIQGVEAEAVSTGRSLGAPARASSGSDGEVTFEDLNAGGAAFSFRLSGEGASPESAVTSKANRSLKAGETWALEVRLPRPALAIEGRALDAAGKPIAGARVLAIFEPTFTERYAFGTGTAESGAGGAFRVAGLVPGDYRVRLFGKGPGGTERVLGERAGVKPGEASLDLAVAAGELPVLVEGSCVNADTGNPVVASEVRIEVAGKVAASDKSDSDGRFSLAVVLSKDLPNILRVTHRQYGFEERFLHLSEVGADGRYPELAFTVSRRKPEDGK